MSRDTPLPNGKRLKETGYRHSFHNKGEQERGRGRGLTSDIILQ